MEKPLQYEFETTDEDSEHSQGSEAIDIGQIVPLYIAASCAAEKGYICTLDSIAKVPRKHGSTRQPAAQR